jgi:1,4-alpha-glucan branching enzyme
MLADLNRLQRQSPALAEWDGDARGFEWLNGDDKDQSTISYVRCSADETLAILLNFTPVLRQGYRMPVPVQGRYREVFNSDWECYGGSGTGAGVDLHSEAVPCNGREHSLVITTPPLACVVLRYEP